MSYCCKDKFKLQEVGDSFQLLQGGSVTSVNGKTGVVVLTPEDIGALPDTYEAPVTSVNEKTGAVVLDAGDIGYDSTETYSDSTVGKELTTINSALSSLSAVTEIIDTASGAIASFPDGSGLPMRSLLATIEPQQDLHGYDSPWAAGAGKNLFDESAVAFGHWINGNGTESTQSSYGCVGAAVPVTGGANVGVACFGNTPFSFSVVEYKSDNTFIQRDHFSNVATATITLQANTAYIKLQISCGNTSSDVMDSTVLAGYKAVLYLGSTAPTVWTPYANECPITGWTGLSGWVEDEYDPTAQSTFSVSWQTEAGTVYGGMLDVVSGLLTVDRAKLVLDENIPSGTSGFRNITELSEGVRAEYYPYRAIGLATDAPVISDKFKGANTGTGTPFTVDTASANPRMYICLPSAYNTEALFRSWFASNPSEFVYYLATPQTYQLTPQQISTLLGNNTVFVDCGSVSVTYQASIKGYIDKVLAS